MWKGFVRGISGLNTPGPRVGQLEVSALEFKSGADGSDRKTEDVFPALRKSSEGATSGPIRVPGQQVNISGDVSAKRPSFWLLLLAFTKFPDSWSVS